MGQEEKDRSSRSEGCRSSLRCQISCSGICFGVELPLWLGTLVTILNLKTADTMYSIFYITLLGLLFHIDSYSLVLKDLPALLL